jgi:hypothetical protein
MKTSHSSFRCWIIVASVSTHLGACAGPSPSALSGQPIVAVEYRQVFLTGSHIPVRVPVSPTARIAPTISPLTILTPEEIVRAVGPTPFPMH